MRELSIFVDESESDDLSDRHYLLTVVMHDQSDSIADSIEAYESAADDVDVAGLLVLDLLGEHGNEALSAFGRLIGVNVHALDFSIDDFHGNGHLVDADSLGLVLVWPKRRLGLFSCNGVISSVFCCGEHAVRPPPTMAATPAVTPPRTKPLREIPVLIPSILPYPPVNDCSFRCI